MKGVRANEEDRLIHSWTKRRRRRRRRESDVHIAGENKLMQLRKCIRHSQEDVFGGELGMGAAAAAVLSPSSSVPYSGSWPSRFSAGMEWRENIFQGRKVRTNEFMSYKRP